MKNSSGRIRITRQHWDHLCGHVLPGDGLEHAAFLLAGVRRDADTTELIVREVIAVDDRRLTGGPQAYFLEVEPEQLVTVVNRAVREELALVEVHSHPDADVGGVFSLADEAGFHETVPYMLGSLPVSVYGALVIGGPTDVSGALWEDSEDKRTEVRSVDIVGPVEFTRIGRSGRTRPAETEPMDDDLARFDRQVRAFGRLGHSRLAELRVAIVGLGGLGSIVVRQLARIGVRHFVIVDDDYVETTNLNRLDGGLVADALGSVPKIAVAIRGILEAAPNASIVPHRKSVMHQDAISDVAACDLIIGGTDNVASRFALNDIALTYLRPYLDIATEIHTEDGSLGHIGGRFTFTFPGTGCLLCSRAMDASEAAAEFVPQAVKDRNRRDGYIQGSLEPAPSVMPLNAVLASHAVLEVLMWATGVRPIIPQILFDGMTGTTTKVQFERNPLCDRCAELLGRGDFAGLGEKYGRWAA
jgi:molybdopterin/thiamine biosynthesis adenylyltransferase